MNPVLRRPLLPTLVLVLLAASSASAQSPEWYWGGRVSWVNASATSDELGDADGELKMHSGWGFDVDATLMVTDGFGVELSVGSSTHRICLTGGDWGDIDAGRLWLAPLTAIAQYHPPIYGQLDPYLGLGATWTVPVYSQPNAVTEAGIQELDFDGGLGVAAQLGVNLHLDHRWLANLDLRYLGSSLDVRVRTDEGDLPPVVLDIEPFVVSLGFGYKF